MGVLEAAIRRLGIMCLIGCFCSVSGVSQDALHVDGVCLFSTDQISEPLYSFPPDRRSEDLIHDIGSISFTNLKISIKAANVPQVAAADTGSERLVLYNPYVLDKFETEGHRDWGIALILAHQMGHHASGHSLTIESALRSEEELEADRFAGFALYRLGASLDVATKATGVFPKEQQNAAYPKQKSRIAAVIEGWHDGKAQVGGAENFESDGVNIPRFPVWPLPRASANTDIPRILLTKRALRPRLMDVSSRLEYALDKAGYGERSLYAVPGGFALVSRIEQINPDGTAKTGDLRWPLQNAPPRIFSLTSYLRTLFTSNPGLYRVIVFVVTSEPLVLSKPALRYDSPKEWVWAGANKLPTVIGFTDFTENASCTALVYEFRQPAAGAETLLSLPGLLPGRTHLERSMILQALEEK